MGFTPLEVNTTKGVIFQVNLITHYWTLLTG